MIRNQIDELEDEDGLEEELELDEDELDDEDELEEDEGFGQGPTMALMLFVGSSTVNSHVTVSVPVEEEPQ